MQVSKQLIVNGDDFGLTEGVNQGILRAHREGILTSATLLANGKAFDLAVSRAREEPKLGVGVHLNLTHGRPVSDPSEVPGLVNSDGNFYGGPAGLLRRMLSRRILLTDVEREFATQIERVLRVGIAATHLDSHKHVHMLPKVFSVVLRLAQRYGIRAVRLADERTAHLANLLRRHPGRPFRLARQYLLARVLGISSATARRELQLAGLRYPMYFYGLTQTGFLDREELERILRDTCAGTSELMCHPGYADSELASTGTRLREEREQELEALVAPGTREFAAQLGIRFVHYGQLSEG